MFVSLAGEVLSVVEGGVLYPLAPGLDTVVCMVREDGSRVAVHQTFGVSTHGDPVSGRSYRVTGTGTMDEGFGVIHLRDPELVEA